MEIRRLAFFSGQGKSAPPVAAALFIFVKRKYGAHAYTVRMRYCSTIPASDYNKSANSRLPKYDLM